MGPLDALTRQFDLDPARIAAAVSDALRAGGEPKARLWRACRTQSARSSTISPAHEPVAGWATSVLHGAARDPARVAAHVRGRQRVYDDWGFARKSLRGLGVSSLSRRQRHRQDDGRGGLALELGARSLPDRPHQVVSNTSARRKEPPPRVRRGRDGGTILLFDEADALFGKRTEVKDSHDRYAKHRGQLPAANGWRPTGASRS